MVEATGFGPATRGCKLRRFTIKLRSQGGLAGGEIGSEQVNLTACFMSAIGFGVTYRCLSYVHKKTSRGLKTGMVQPPASRFRATSGSESISILALRPNKKEKPSAFSAKLLLLWAYYSLHFPDRQTVIFRAA